MSEVHKIVGIRYPTYYDRALGRTPEPRVVEVFDKSDIKSEIENMLFHSDKSLRANYVIVRWGGKMYSCDPLDEDKRQFVKTDIEMHPYEHLA